MKLIHLSDFHLTAPGVLAWGLDPHDRASRVLDDIARLHGDAAFCVISGDIAHDRDPRAYRWLASRLRNFPLRTILMAGNHDDRAAMRAELPEIMNDGNGFIQGTLDTPEGLFVFLDTQKHPTITAGQFCPTRRTWLRARLEEARGRPVRLFMHHPPFDIGLPRVDRIKLEDARAFGVALQGHDIRHIFFGHIHRPVYVQWRGIGCTAVPGTAHQMPLADPAGAFTVEPAMYAVVLVRGDSTIVNLDAPLDRRPVPGPR